MSWKDIANLDNALAHGLKENEFIALKNSLNRDLSILELGICSALFSEHCSYKSSKIHLRNLPSKGARVLQGPGENAGIIDIGDGDAVVFKVESHNHPSYIEPFQGAATGIGGILRDVFTMGARPLVLMNALRFGAASHFKTKYLLSGAIAGIGSYGNCMGVPTLGGELYFHKSYNGNCLVNAFALGLVRTDRIFRGNASGIGNSIIYVGSKTGRDGIHGATMASDVFDEASESKRPTVQVGDPFQEKLLLEACLEAMHSGAVVGIQDMGAAGLTSSAYEMSERAGSGIRLDLDSVPQRETNMNPYEIMLSESQERMLIVIKQGTENKLNKIFNKWGLDSVKIGTVIEGNSVELYWHGELVSKMSHHDLNQAIPEYSWPEAKVNLEQNNFDINSVPDLTDANLIWLQMLSSINLCSRSPVYEQYDSSVRSNTVIFPGGDAGVIRIKPNESYSLGADTVKLDADLSAKEKGIAVTIDCNSLYCFIDPKLGTEHTVAEAYRNITAVGAEPIGISDCLNFGSPEKPDGMREIAEAIRGLTKAANEFNLPVVSGNVSLYNESTDSRIFPTPMIAMVGLMPDAKQAVSTGFKNEGDQVFVLTSIKSLSLSGSLYLSECHSIEQGYLLPPDYELERKTAQCLLELVNEKLVNSCHDISVGGLAVALAECAITSDMGVQVELNMPCNERKDLMLFGEGSAGYIISCSANSSNQVLKTLNSFGLKAVFVGFTGGKKIAIKPYAEIELNAAKQNWMNGLKVVL